MSFYLTRKAKADLKSIGRYIQKIWGVNQRNTYLTEIDRAFHDISNNPNIGRNCDYIRSGYRKYKVGKHYIFYREVSIEEVEIVRVLHERMDISRHLSTD